MSKLEELIARLCPDGVEYKKLCDCVKSISNINWNKAEGQYRYIDLSSVDRDKHCILETQVVNADNAPSRAKQIILKDDVLVGTTRPLLKRYCIIPDDYDNNICSTGFCVLRAEKSIVLPRWIYHNVSSNDFFAHVELFQKGASYPAISDKELKEYKLPVPPLEVQREIVHILDSFTFLTAELAAELAARQKQYEWYKRNLIEDTSGSDDLFRLKDVASYVRERVYIDTISKENYVGVENLLQDKKGKTNATTIPSSGNVIGFEKDDILLGNIRPYLKKIWFADIEGGTNGDVLAIRANTRLVLPKYLYYILSTDTFFLYDNSHSKGAKMPRGNKEAIMDYDFSLPPLSEQQRIVDILDRFDALCNDITSGLPAEIEARRKQYEYYRDKLLTFKELKKEA